MNSTNQIAQVMDIITRVKHAGRNVVKNDMLKIGTKFVSNVGVITSKMQNILERKAEDKKSLWKKLKDGVRTILKNIKLITQSVILFKEGLLRKQINVEFVDLKLNYMPTIKTIQNLWIFCGYALIAIQKFTQRRFKSWHR